MLASAQPTTVQVLFTIRAVFLYLSPADLNILQYAPQKIK